MLATSILAGAADSEAVFTSEGGISDVAVAQMRSLVAVSSTMKKDQYLPAATNKHLPHTEINDHAITAQGQHVGLAGPCYENTPLHFSCWGGDIALELALAPAGAA